MTLSGVVDASTLKTDFDQRTTPLSNQAVLGIVDHDVFHRVAAMATGAGVLNFLDWMSPDDNELRVIRIRVEHSAASRVVTATLTQTDGDASFLVDQTFVATVTSVNGTVEATADFRTVTGKRARLLRGVRYRLTLAVDAGATINVVQGTVVVRTRRRSA